MNQTTSDYLSFRRMITPGIIQVIFWVLIVGVVLFCMVGMLASAWVMIDQDFGTGLAAMIGQFVTLLVMPIVIRIYCELIILFFRANETLTDIKNLLANREAEPLA